MLLESIPLETRKPYDADVVYKIMMFIRSERIIINMLHDEMMAGTYSLPILTDVDIDSSHSIDATGKFAVRIKSGSLLRSITTPIDMDGNIIILTAAPGKAVTVAHGPKISLADGSNFVLTSSKVLALLCKGHEKWVEITRDYIDESPETFYTSDEAMFVCRPSQSRGQLEQFLVQPQ